MPEPFNLDRFVVAQEPVFTASLDELRSGRKRTRWMWFIFPQLRGRGHSTIAEFCGIGSLDEARAYLAHPLLGLRLQLCTEAVLGISDRSLHAIFGSPDDIKLRSSMTLFALAVGKGDSVFRRALDRYCDGRMDEQTVSICETSADRLSARLNPEK